MVKKKRTVVVYVLFLTLIPSGVDPLDRWTQPKNKYLTDNLLTYYNEFLGWVAYYLVHTSQCTQPMYKSKG
jgi:hypothetical protein